MQRRIHIQHTANSPTHVLVSNAGLLQGQAGRRRVHGDDGKPASQQAPRSAHRPWLSLACENSLHDLLVCAQASFKASRLQILGHGRRWVHLAPVPRDRSLAIGYLRACNPAARWRPAQQETTTTRTLDYDCRVCNFDGHNLFDLSRLPSLSQIYRMHSTALAHSRAVARVARAAVSVCFQRQYSPALLCCPSVLILLLPVLLCVPASPRPFVLRCCHCSMHREVGLPFLQPRLTASCGHATHNRVVPLVLLPSANSACMPYV